VRTAAIEPGAAVTFVQNDESLASGTVNGAPLVYWNGSEVCVYVPVHIHRANHNVMVAGYNVRSVISNERNRRTA
jgi:hypothetical protein